LLQPSRSAPPPFFFPPPSDEELGEVVRLLSLDHPERRIPLSVGSPGVAMSLDLEQYDRIRSAMFALLRVAAGAAPFSEWMKHSEAIARARSEKLELYLKVLYTLLRDLLVLRETGGEIRNRDIRPQLEPLAQKVSFSWIRAAARKVDELSDLLRRNIQKTIA